MLEKDRIIVLHTIKHSDSGMVVQCYSATRGRTACYFFAKSKNSRNSQMFPLSVLDVVLHFRTQNGGAMPMIKEAVSRHAADTEQIQPDALSEMAPVETENNIPSE